MTTKEATSILAAEAERLGADGNDSTGVLSHGSRPGAGRPRSADRCYCGKHTMKRANTLRLRCRYTRLVITAIDYETKTVWLEPISPTNSAH